MGHANAWAPLAVGVVVIVCNGSSTGSNINHFAISAVVLQSRGPCGALGIFVLVFNKETVVFRLLVVVRCWTARCDALVICVFCSALG